MTMQPALLVVAASGAMLIASRASARGQVESGDGSASFDFGNLTDTMENFMNQTTQLAMPASASGEVATRNVYAFLKVIRRAEGTDGISDPYRVCYGYSHTIADLGEHPAITGEWRGKVLPDSMCKNAGFGPGCVSTAAGAYQLIRPTWVRVRDALGLRDFGQASQDAAAIELIRRRGALEDVKDGRLSMAVNKCRNEWASLPGNYAQQGQRNMAELVAWFQQSGGMSA